ncbi:MAG: hypothetical protein E7300_00935 [Lachnospiraceae bacterium]|nr:hypothetical protein [Lachnospiraceae bacterium]
MKVQKIFCDRCGKEIPGNFFRIIPELLDPVSEDFVDRENMSELTSMQIDKDYCEDCAKKIKAFISQREDSERGSEKEAKKEPAAKQEETKNAVTLGQPAKKTYDRGKICALYKAGWNASKIADEMGCTVQTAINILTKEGVYEKRKA